MQAYRHFFDWVAMGSAAVAAFSLANAALTVTIVAGLVSIVIGMWRLYDRWRFGPAARSWRD